jgi:hypothetical protein
MSSNAKWDQLPTLTAEEVYAEYGPTLEVSLQSFRRIASQKLYREYLSERGRPLHVTFSSFYIVSSK